MYIIFGLSFIVTIILGLVISLRRVVPTNEIHIVQKSKSTVCYGKGIKDSQGNVYYKFPAWVPIAGITVSVISATVEELEVSFITYDKEKIGFNVAITGAYRVTDFQLASGRIYSMNSLKNQLISIIQNKACTILGSVDIEELLKDRVKYSKQLTNSVSDMITEWGVSLVTDLNIINVMDVENSNIIQCLTEKRKSEVEKNSTLAILENQRQMQEAQIKFDQDMALKKQDSDKVIELNQVQNKAEISITEEKQKQEVHTVAILATEKELEVKKLQEVDAAKIEKSAALINAEKEQIQSDDKTQELIASPEVKAILEKLQQSTTGKEFISKYI